MNLCKEILVKIPEDENVQINIVGLNDNISKLFDLECYKALEKIKAVIEDDSLEDKDCFMRIEEIIRIYENIGSNGGFRHDF